MKHANDNIEDKIARMKTRVDRAIWTDACEQMPSPKQPRSAMPDYRAEGLIEAINNKIKPRFTPTSRDIDDCLPVMDVLTKFKQENEPEFQIIYSSAWNINNTEIMDRLIRAGESFGKGNDKSQYQAFRRRKQVAYRALYEFDKEFWDDENERTNIKRA